MANIQCRTSADGAKTYRVQVRLKGHPAQTATFQRLTDARKWAQATEAAIREGRHFKTTEAKRRTLADLIDRYLRDVLPHKAPGTVEAQTIQLRWWRDQIGIYSLADVSSAVVAEYRDRLTSEPKKDGKPRSSAIVNRYLAALSHAFTMAKKEWRWTTDNPVLSVGRKKEPRGRVRFLSDDERDKLLHECRASESPELYTAVALALSTGARRMEIIGLHWSQVDFQRGVITLHETKNGDRRLLPLTGRALELMRERSKVRQIGTDLVFPSRIDPKRPADLRSAFNYALKRAGIEDFRWHDLRHSAASYLAMNGASLAEIAEVLGHKTLAMVKRYSHLSEAHTAQVVARMNAKIFRQP